jgi:hypothetical protein
MNDASLSYLVDLQKKVYSLYDAEELQTLCFMLGVDYDSLRGNAKQTKVNALILRLARTGRLQDLIDQASEDRTHVDWFDPPENLELPDIAEHGTTATTYYVNTGGGAFVGGSVTSGGAFAGRDHLVQGDQVGGDRYDLSGDFRGAAVNINSRLEHAVQSVTGMPHGTPEDRERLAGLLGELRSVLAQAPPEQAADADAIARRIEVLAEEAENQNPDKALIDQIADSVRRAAGKLAPKLPRLLPILTAIFELVRSLMRNN